MAYEIKPAYVSRVEPTYFEDALPDSTAWQADVYRLAGILARQVGAKRLVDVGCGRGEKLIRYADEFQLVGFDYGGNIDYCQQHHASGTWNSTNLNIDVAPAQLFTDSVVICADVIEHLPTPDALIQTLHNAAETAKYVLVSTPDRMRIYKHDHNGPPGNLSHCREWTLEELEAWFTAESLPIRWGGWTISNDARPDQVHTSLLVLSKAETVDSLPLTFQPAPHWRKKSKIGNNKRLKVWMTPTPSEAGRDTTNAIHQIVCRLDGLLPDYDVELVEQPDQADLRAGHAGQGSSAPIDVAHYHGLYPTGMGMDGVYFAINSHVIQNLKTAKAVTAPSEWIADVIRRDMHISPHIVGWGVDTDEWTPVKEPHVYVLWNKARVDAVSDPTPMLQLAAKAHNVLFLTTFGDGTPNVKTIGRQPYEVMKQHVRHAGVYLATATETFGIATVEAMACGVPVLGFRHGNTAHLVEHGVTGFLAEPDDLDGLYEGLRYCLKYRNTLGANAREAAKHYTWDRVAQQMAEIYRGVLEPHQGAKCSVIIPCHNYAQYVMEAVESVRAQTTTFDFEIIVVNDSSTDQSADILRRALTRPNEIYCEVDYGNLSATRNHGIEKASGEYLACLDADDRLGSPLFLQTLADALDADRTLGIAFTSIRVMDADGKLGHLNAWPKGYDFDAQAARRNQVPSCCLFRKEAWRRAGGFRPHFIYAQDAEFWLTVGAIGYGAKHVVEDGWFHYRLHNKSQSQVHRTGEISEPDWTEFHPWTKDNQRPFAAAGKPPNGSWPVRFYLKPDVSIVIPVGPGHEELVKDALHSVEGQTHRFWECIVVNDSGKPLCLEGFPWAKVVNTSGCLGAGAARNLGVKQVHVPFLVFLDADDMLKPTFLEATLKAYQQNGRYAYTDWFTQDARGQKQVHATPEYSFEAIWGQPSIHAVSALIPRKWFESAGGFDESLPAYEDVDFFMKLLTKGYCGVRVAEPLLLYNLHQGKRRIAGEKRKDEFRALLKKRYSQYMEGKEMCCTDPPKGKAPVPPTPENAAEYRDSYGEMIKVRWTWEYAPEGVTTFKGSATHAPYGRRAKGEIFYIWEKDFVANPEMFTRLESYLPETQDTLIPPAPELVTEVVEFEPLQGIPADLSFEEPAEKAAPAADARSDWPDNAKAAYEGGEETAEWITTPEPAKPPRKPSAKKKAAVKADD